MTGRSMVGEPAGWYRDPAPRNQQAPDTVRWWDGMSWTAQVRTASKQDRQAWLAEDALAFQAQYDALVARANAGDVEAQRFLTAPAAEGTRSTTPDGVALAGWGRRFSAYLIDYTLTSILGLVLSWRFIKQIATAYDQFVHAYVDASRRHAPLPSTKGFADAVVQPLVWMSLTIFAVAAVYEIAFLKGYGATPGKLLVGIEVRLRDRPGPLSWETVLLRSAGKSLVAIVALIPLGSLVYWLYWWLDALWPLWDPKRQALHEKLPGTNVVRR